MARVLRMSGPLDFAAIRAVVLADLAVWARCDGRLTTADAATRTVRFAVAA